MNFQVSLAGALLLVLSLPLVLAKPEKARASGGGRAGVPPSIKTIYPTFTLTEVGKGRQLMFLKRCMKRTSFIKCRLVSRMTYL
jgi:hypothetical protein